MRKLILLFAIILLVGCAPSPEDIQRAIEQTQAANPTYTPEPTSTKTPTKAPTQRPTITPTPAPNYILENGFCIMSINNVTTDPDQISGCGRQAREQVYIGPGQEMVVTFTHRVNELQWYCALFDLDHNFIMVDIDTTGSGKAACHP